MLSLFTLCFPSVEALYLYLFFHRYGAGTIQRSQAERAI